MNRQSCLNALTAVIVYAAIPFIAGCAAPVQPDHAPARYRHLALEDEELQLLSFTIHFLAASHVWTPLTKPESGLDQ